MPNVDLPIVTIRDARLIFKNFEGKPTRFNKAGGARSFGVLLDDDVARAMEADDLNVKWLDSKDVDGPPQAFLPVAVNFSNRPPNIIMITSKNPRGTRLSEEEINIIDWVDIKKVDLTIRPHKWEVNDATGVKTYLKTMFITIEEDDLEMEYADLNDLPARAGKVSGDDNFNE